MEQMEILKPTNPIETPDSYLLKLNVCKQTVANLNNQIELDERKKSELEAELLNLEQVHELLTKLKQFKMDSKKEFILKTINTALKDIFQKEIRIDIEASSNLDNGKINMKYDIILFQNNIEIARNEKLIESNGGGVLSVISILFKMLVGFIYSDNKFYMFDESLSQVSEEFRPRISKFLKEFCEKHQFTIILVSHTKDLDIYADTIYSLTGSFDKDDIPVLHIDEVIGTYPDNNYIYAKIKNFQSIVDLEFRFKGFTIIRGENNIGKSASLRAINAVIFNDFDKDHQRITTARSIETSIEFGYYHLDEEGKLDETKKIRVSYKSQKVNYEFDGMTFAGKNLAFDKVQEKIESIGFRYINLKETYKNFKGNLKEQTERLSLTTQHDGLFLIGAKNTDSSKVFDFLFDSYQVANAISRVKIDINERLNLVNDCNLRIIENTNILKREKIKEQYFVYKYYISVINLSNSLFHKINILEHHIGIKEKIKSYLDNIIYIFNVQNYITGLKTKLNIIENNPNQQLLEKLEIIITKGKSILLFKKSYSDLIRLNKLCKNIDNLIQIKDKYNSIIQLGKFKLMIQNYIFTQNKYNDFLHQEMIIISNLNKVVSIIDLYKKAITYIQSKEFILNSIVYINETNRTIAQKNLVIEDFNNQLLLLSDEFGLEKCAQCGGIGYTHNH